MRGRYIRTLCLVTCAIISLSGCYIDNQGQVQEADLSKLFATPDELSVYTTNAANAGRADAPRISNFRVGETHVIYVRNDGNSEKPVNVKVWNMNANSIVQDSDVVLPASKVFMLSGQQQNPGFYKVQLSADGVVKAQSDFAVSP